MARPHTSPKVSSSVPPRWAFLEHDRLICSMPLFSFLRLIRPLLKSITSPQILFFFKFIYKKKEILRYSFSSGVPVSLLVQKRFRKNLASVSSKRLDPFCGAFLIPHRTSCERESSNLLFQRRRRRPGLNIDKPRTRSLSLSRSGLEQKKKKTTVFPCLGTGVAI